MTPNTKRPALRIGLEYGQLLTHLVDAAKAQSGRLGDRGEALCGGFCSFVYGSWATATGADREMICSQCEQMAGDDVAEATRRQAVLTGNKEGIGMSAKSECRECPQMSMRDYIAAKLADELDSLIAEARTAPTPMAPAAADTLYRVGFYAGRVSGLEAALALVRVMFGVKVPAE